MRENHNSASGFRRAATAALLALPSLLFGWGAPPVQGDDVVLYGAAEGPRCLVFSSDGKLLASNGLENKVLIWDTSPWKLRETLEHSERPTPIAFVPGQSKLISFSRSGDVILWDLTATRPKWSSRPLETGGTPFPVSTDGKTVAIPSFALIDRRLECWIDVFDLSDFSKKTVLKGSWNPNLHDVAFSPDGKRLALFSDSEEEIRTWRLDAEAPARSLNLSNGGTMAVVFSPDSTALAAANGFKRSDGSVLLWDMRSTKGPQVLESPAETVWSLVFTSDGSHLIGAASAIVDFSQSQAVVIWNLKTKKSQMRLISGRASLKAIAVSPDGQTLALARYDGTTRILKVSELVRLFEGK